MSETGADDICIMLTCGHSRPRWLGAEDSVLTRLWCRTCQDMVPWVRAGWSGAVPAPEVA